MGVRLTLHRLRAIEEALCHRLAGPIEHDGDPGEPRQVDYDRALDWVVEMIGKRTPYNPRP